MEYHVVVAEGVEELERLVNKKISEGYEPIGGISVHPETTTMYFCLYQAMTRDQEDKNCAS